MQLWIAVENFAKIECAKVCMNEYTLLVGQNNSGKTFLMQLIQGMSKKLAGLVGEDIIPAFVEEKKPNCCKYTISGENVAQLAAYLNDKLGKAKEEIVKEIFGKEIAIERLYVEIACEPAESYEIYEFESEESISTEFVQEQIGMKMPGWVSDGLSGQKVGITIKKNGKQRRVLSLMEAMLNGHVSIVKNGLRHLLESESLFLPSSRTGLMLLYREFFANKTDHMVGYSVVRENQIYSMNEKQGDFTKPVYEFLRFLQTYSESEYSKKRFSSELMFFESKLIEGRISVDKQGTFAYNSGVNEPGIPMYLASSMINEIAPLYLAVTSGRFYDRFIIDEAEASLHPEKQLELVRFLNRLNNRGISIMVSTHSDTFASKLNNLYLLAERVKNSEEDILSKFGLESQDLPNPQKLHVYEFTIQPNGKSVVKEVFRNEKTGYQFDLFTKSALHLYDEAMKMLEISNDKCES